MRATLAILFSAAAALAVATVTDVPLTGDVLKQNLEIDVEGPVHLEIIRSADVPASTLKIAHDDAVKVTHLVEANKVALSIKKGTSTLGTRTSDISSAASLRSNWLVFTALAAVVVFTPGFGRSNGRRPIWTLLGCAFVLLCTGSTMATTDDANKVTISLPEGLKFNVASVNGASFIACTLNSNPLANEMTVDGFEVLNGEACQPDPFAEPLGSFQCIDTEENLMNQTYHHEPTLAELETYAKDNGFRYYAVTGITSEKKIRHSFVARGVTQWSSATKPCLAYGDFSKKNEADSASWAVYETNVNDPGQLSTDCAVGTWKDLKEDCGPCKLLLNNAGNYDNRCDKYCQSIGRQCTGSWDDGNSNTCTAEKTGTCTTTWSGTSDIICQCSSGETQAEDPPETPGDCDVTKWKDLKAACGPCHLLINNAGAYGGSCDKYCKSLDRVCVASADDRSSNTCRAEAEGDCSTVWESTSDIICTCSGDDVPPPAPTMPPTAPPTLPTVPHTGAIEIIATTEAYAAKGVVTISKPAGTQDGDLMVLILHRTDDDLPVRVDNWNPVAQCYKRDNGYECSTAADCVSWQKKPYICGNFGSGGGGHDLAQSVHVRRATPNEAGSYTFNLNEDASGHPGWAVLTTLRGADVHDPVRDWSFKGCDGSKQSIFPSVDVEAGDMILLSQSFDDKIGREFFGPPAGFTSIGYVAEDDETAFLYSKLATKSGATGKMTTTGAGSWGCKDALVSLAIKPQA